MTIPSSEDLPPPIPPQVEQHIATLPPGVRYAAMRQAAIDPSSILRAARAAQDKRP